MSGIEDVLRFLDHVDIRTLGSVAEKLKKSRSKKEQAVGAFLSRVYAYRTEGAGAAKPPEKGSTVAPSSLFSGLRDIR